MWAWRQQQGATHDTSAWAAPVRQLRALAADARTLLATATVTDVATALTPYLRRYTFPPPLSLHRRLYADGWADRTAL
jgi:hypothetical protein